MKESYNIMLACLYCGDTMGKPSDDTVAKAGNDVLNCCNYRMAEIDMDESYRVIRTLDKLRENIEHELIKDL